MQYFSKWSPISSPSRMQREQREKELHAPPQIERTKMKSAPSQPLLSEPVLLGKDLERYERQNAEQDLQSKLDKNPYEALARHQSERVNGAPSTPEPVMDVTTASIHPSEGSYNSPSQGDYRYDDEDKDLHTPQHEIDMKHVKEGKAEDEPQTTITAPGLTMTFAEALTSSPKSPHESPTDSAQAHGEPSPPARDTTTPTPYEPEATLAEESDQTAVPSPVTIPRRRSLLPPSLHAHNKRFSTGSMSVHFSPPSESPPLSAGQASAASASQLDRIQTLLTKTATQLHALERVQAANWERAVSMLMESADQIAELRRGQERLGKTCEELRRTVEAVSEKGNQWDKYDIRRPPRKMGRKIVGYVYEKNGDGASGRKVVERKMK